VNSKLIAIDNNLTRCIKSAFLSIAITKVVIKKNSNIL